MKKVIALMLAIVMLTQLFAVNHFVLTSAAETSLKRNIIADWDDPDRTPVTPAGARVGIPYSGYEFGNGLLTGPNMITLTPNSSSEGDTMFAVRVKSFETYSPNNVNWINMFLYDDAQKPKALVADSQVYYIPTSGNAAQMGRFDTISKGIYRYTTTDQNFALEKGYDGWIVFSLSDFKRDWWGVGNIKPVEADKISAVHIANGLENGSLFDEVQTFNGTISEFYDECGKKTETQGIIRNVIADWDDATRSPAAPAGATVAVPFQNYEFGKGLLTGTNTISLTPNAEAVGDTMLAIRVKNFETYSSSSLYWTNMLLYDHAGKPKALATGAKVYYIPTIGNTANMVRFQKIVDGLFCYTTTTQNFGFEKGYDGWVVFSLSDFNVDWWNGGVRIDGVSAEKISAIDIVADLPRGSLIDEIQTFDGSVIDFKKVCGRRPSDPQEPIGCEHTALQHFPAKEATCQENGNIEYWYCPDCNVYFGDSNASQVIDSYSIPMLDKHSYQDGKCKWCDKTELKPDPVVEANMGNLLVDWDSALPLGVNADQVNNISGYGTSVIFDGSQMNLIPDIGSGYRFSDMDNALAFYMIMPKGPQQSFHFMMLEQSGEGYQLKSNFNYTLIDKTGNITQKESVDSTISLAGGYVGWVVIELSSLEIHPAYPVIDGVLTPSAINNIQYFAFNGDGPYYFDQYYSLNMANINGFAAVCNKNRENVGDPPEPEKPPTELDPSDDANRTGLMCNFDDVNSTIIQTAANYEVTTGDSFDGKYVKWKANDMLSPFLVGFNPQGRTFDTAVIMRFKVLSSTSYDLYFAVHDTLKPGKTELYQFKNKSTVYIIDSENHFKSKQTMNQKINLEAGFDGWLLIPFSSLERHVGWFKHNQVLNIENITAIQFWGGDRPGEFALDDIQTIPNIYDFATEHSDYIPPVPNSVIMNDFEKGEISQDSNIENWNAYCDPANATLSQDTDRNMDGTIALQIESKANAEVRTKVFLTNNDRKSSVSYGHIGAYVNNFSNKDLKLSLGVKTKDGVYYLKSQNYSKDYYLLSNGSTGNTSAHPISGDIITIPAGFSGYLVWHLSSYYNPIDILSLEEVILKVPASSQLIVDNISIINDVDTYITQTINSKTDSDYLLSNSNSVIIKNGTITLSDTAISSTIFRENVSIRRGFYIVFGNGEDEQVFGVQRNMNDIKNVNVFQSGKLMKSYRISNYVVKPKDSPNESTPEDDKKPVSNETNKVTKYPPLTDSVTGISVGYYEAIAFAKGTNLVVNPLPNKALPTDVYKYVKTRRYIPYDISLVNNNSNINLEGILYMTFNIPDSFDKDKALIYRVTEDGWLEDMQAELKDNLLVIYTKQTGIYILLQDATDNIGNKADMYGVDVNQGMNNNKEQIRVKHKGVRSVGGFNVIWIIIPVASVLIVGATVTGILLIRRKKKHN